MSPIASRTRAGAVSRAPSPAGTPKLRGASGAGRGARPGSRRAGREGGASVGGARAGGVAATRSGGERVASGWRARRQPQELAGCRLLRGPRAGSGLPGSPLRPWPGFSFVFRWFQIGAVGNVVEELSSEVLVPSPALVSLSVERQQAQWRCLRGGREDSPRRAAERLVLGEVGGCLARFLCPLLCFNKVEGGLGVRVRA